MYKELEKYKTGKKTKINATIVNTGREVFYMGDEYEFKLGELIQDFIKHESKPRIFRKFYHDHLSELYKRFLNKVSIKSGL